MTRTRSGRPLSVLLVLLAWALAPVLGSGCRPEAGSAQGPEAGLVLLDVEGPRPFFHDFGTRPWGERLRHVFRLQNRDPQPVTVLDITPSCVCTLASIAYTGTEGERVEGRRGRETETVITIPPGAVAEFAIEIDTARVEKPNVDKLSVVRLRCDSPATPFLTFELHVVARRAFRAVPAALELGPTPQSAGRTGRADLSVAVFGDRSRLGRIVAVEGPFETALEQAQVGEETLWVLLASLPAGLPLGPVHGGVTLETFEPDGAPGAPFEVPLSALVVPDVSVLPAAFLLTGLERGRVSQLVGEVLALVPGERVGVNVVRLEGEAAEHLAVSAEPFDLDAQGRASRWTLTLRTLPSLQLATFRGEIVLELDHARVHALRVPYAGTLR